MTLFCFTWAPPFLSQDPNRRGRRQNRARPAPDHATGDRPSDRPATGRPPQI